jgi:transposase InsO family protein
MVDYIDRNRDRFGIEPICRQLQIAPSTYYEQKLRQADPSRLPARMQRDAELRPQIHRVWHANFCAYGVHKTWKQLNREHIRVARCTVRRLMRDLGLRGIVRGKGFKTTIPDEAALRLFKRRCFESSFLRNSHYHYVSRRALPLVRKLARAPPAFPIPAVRCKTRRD